MIANKERIGRFTSSNIYKLIKSGRGNSVFSAPALTYIDEINIERRMGRSIDTGASSRAMAWGKFMEFIIFSHLGMGYKILADESKVHPKKAYSDFWGGSADLLIPKKVTGEIKCYEPKAFSKLTDAILTFDTEHIKETCPKEYWQVVSNSILHETPEAELITFMPYESELADIAELARNYEGADQYKYRYIYETFESGENFSLPILPDGGYYENINIFRFKVPQHDIDFLHQRADLAIQLLDK